MAQEHGVRFIPHGWNTAVGLAADLHLASAFPDTDLVEYIDGSPYIDEIMAGGWRARRRRHAADPGRPRPRHRARPRRRRPPQRRRPVGRCVGSAMMVGWKRDERREVSRVALASEATMSVTKLYTAADLLAMGSDAPFELIEGELVEVSPSKGRASEFALNFVEPLRRFVRRHRLGRVYRAPTAATCLRATRTRPRPRCRLHPRSNLLPRRLPRGRVYPAPARSGGRGDVAIRSLDRSRTQGPALPRRRHPPGLGGAAGPARPSSSSPPAARRWNSARTTELDGEDVLPGFRLPVREVFADPLAS